MPEAEKLDLKKQMAPYWSPVSGSFELVDVPASLYLQIDGEGDPNGSVSYERALNWLYSVSYALKFAAKAEGRDYVVAPLEGLWWADDMADFGSGRRDRWQWTMMILQPDFITEAAYQAARHKAADKLGDAPESLRLQTFSEGLSAQTLHVGPYSDEGPVIARLHGQFLPENKLAPTGHHHEIYLSDPRHTQSSKLKTILRQPVKRL